MLHRPAPEARVNPIGDGQQPFVNARSCGVLCNLRWLVPAQKCFVKSIKLVLLKLAQCFFKSDHVLTHAEQLAAQARPALGRRLERLVRHACPSEFMQLWATSV